MCVFYASTEKVRGEEGGVGVRFSNFHVRPGILLCNLFYREDTYKK